MSMRTRLLGACLAAIAFGAAGCGGGQAATEPSAAPVASVVVEPTAAELAVGATVQLSATALDSSGAKLAGRAVSWSSSDGARAQVSASGMVTALAAGDATIHAAMEGRSGAAAIHVIAPAAGSIQWDAASNALASGAEVRLAFNNTAVGARDDQATLHVLWEDGLQPMHGRRAAGASSWTRQPLPASGAVKAQKPTLAYLGGADLIAAWTEAGAASTAIRASRSRDRGASWDAAITVASGPYEGVVSLYAFRRADGTPGAVLAWYDKTSQRAVTAAWRGASWSASDWTAPRVLSSGTSGSSHDAGLGGRGATVYAAWEDSRSGTGNQIYLAKSTDGGASWSVDYPLAAPGAGSIRGQDPALAVAADGSVRVAYQSVGRIVIASAPDGMNFAAPADLGPGLFAHLALNDAGMAAVSWEHFTGDLFDDSTKRVGLALQFPGAAGFQGPHAMPGSDQHAGDVQAAVLLSDAWIDLVWIDTTGGARTLLHRAGRLR